MRIFQLLHDGRPGLNLLRIPKPRLCKGYLVPALVNLLCLVLHSGYTYVPLMKRMLYLSSYRGLLPCKDVCLDRILDLIRVLLMVWEQV